MYYSANRATSVLWILKFVDFEISNFTNLPCWFVIWLSPLKKKISNFKTYNWKNNLVGLQMMRGQAQ